jgi:hypothetical protein
MITQNGLRRITVIIVIIFIAEIKGTEITCKKTREFRLLSCYSAWQGTLDFINRPFLDKKNKYQDLSQSSLGTH